MRVLRPIVHALVLAMLHGKAHLRPCGAVGTELVRDHDAGRRGCRLQELCHEPLRRAAVSAALDEDVEDKAILIDGAPEPMLLARDRDEDFVQMPFVAARGSPLADLISEPLAELLSPLAHGLVGHANPAGQYLLDHAQAQGKPEVEPNRIPDDFRRKAMAAIEGFTSARHGSAYATIRSRSVKLTGPPPVERGNGPGQAGYRATLPFGPRLGRFAIQMLCQATAVACSSRAAVQTSRAALAFMAAIPSPMIKSGPAEGHRKAVTSPAAIMAMLAKASFRDDRKAARVRLPPCAR